MDGRQHAPPPRWRAHSPALRRATRLPLFVCALATPQVDVHLLSQYLTLAFIGFISISSLRWVGPAPLSVGRLREGPHCVAGGRARPRRTPLSLSTQPSRRRPVPPPAACRGFLKQMERFFSGLSAGNATTMVLVTTELLGFYTISTMLLLR